MIDSKRLLSLAGPPWSLMPECGSQAVRGESLLGKKPQQCLPWGVCVPESQSVGWIVYFDVRVTRSNEKGRNGKKRSEQCVKLLFKERIRMANRQVMGILADLKWSLGRKVAVTSTPGLLLDLPSPTPNFGVFLNK